MIKTRWSRGRGWDPANLRLPNERAKCETQLRGGLTSSSQETIFSETLIPSLSAGQVSHFPFLSSLAVRLSTRQLAGPSLARGEGRGKEKLSKRKSGNNGIFIFACYLLVCSLLFSFIVRNELKKKNPREGTGPSPTRNIYLPNIFNENAQTAVCQPPNWRPVDSE